MRLVITIAVLYGVLLGWSQGASALSLSPGEGAKGSEPEAYLQLAELYKNCTLSGVVNNPKYPQCAFASPPTPSAADLMGTVVGSGTVPSNQPLTGVNGTTIVDATANGQSVEGTADSDFSTDAKKPPTLSAELGAGGDAADDEEANDDPRCHNGIYSDGCEEGGRTLKCTFIPPTSPFTPPWGGPCMLLVTIGAILTYRSST